MKTKKIHFAIIVVLIFNLEFWNFKVQAQGCFDVATNFQTGYDPISIITGDFNGDGKADLAMSNFVAGNVSVILGDGAGNFGVADSFAVGTHPRTLTTADFNGDSKADLAFAYYGGLSVLLGDGTGNFGTATSFGGFNAETIVNADFNGDGKIDLATQNGNSNLVSVYLGDGTGGFGSPTNFTIGPYPYSVFTADFNGDSIADLETSNYMDGNITVLLGDGTGGFGSPTNFVAGNSPKSSISGDFNGDGKVDLAIANYGGMGSLSILLGDGAGSFSTPTNFPIGNNPWSITCADFNGDGNSDLALSNYYSNNVSVLFGNGLGGFGTATSVTVGNHPYAITKGDFNGDGKADLATPNEGSSNVSVLLNSPCCSSHFIIYPDTTPHVWIALNQAAGVPPLTYLWNWGDSTTSIGATPSHTYNTPGYYNICLTITDAVGCTGTYCDSSTHIYKNNDAMVYVHVISLTTAVVEKIETGESIAIYPNPTNGKLIIELSNSQLKSNNCVIKICNLLGEKVFQSSSLNLETSNEIDLSASPKGIYFVQIYDGEKNHSEKIVVQ